MKSRKRFRVAVLWISCLMLTAVAQGFADAYGKSRHFSEGANHNAESAFGKNDEGSASGGIAGWLLAIANFPVAASILLKAFGKMALPDSGFRETFKRINLRQKKMLMGLHYWLNPLAMSVAIFHFAVAECESTFFPELGLMVMLLVFILGLMIAFKLTPKSMSRAIFKLHTSPISLTIVLSILLIGHSMVD